jgi:hypothetical protein
MGIYIRITKKQERIIDLHEQVIKNFHIAEKKKIGYFEGQFRCTAMIHLIIFDIEAIFTLAKKDLIYFPTAILIGRRIFDVSTNLVWILKPDDPFEQEARWLRYAHHSRNTELKFYQECLRSAKKKSLDISALHTQCQAINDNYSSVENELEKKFPNKYDHSSEPPSMRDMLSEIGKENDYLIFSYFSHFAHGSIIATQCFTKGFGISKDIGVFISPDDWDICFKTTMMSFIQAGNIYLERTGGDVGLFIPQDLKREIEKTIGVKFNNKKIS